MSLNVLKRIIFLFIDWKEIINMTKTKNKINKKKNL